MKTRWIRIFIWSAGGILLAAGLERLLVAFGHAQALSLPEPVLGIPIRYAVLLVGGFELLVALICLFGRNPTLQLGWLAWLLVNYAVYRIGLLTMHYHQQATGIGTLTDPLHLSRGILGLAIGLVPACLLAGTVAAIAWPWVGKMRPARKPILATSVPTARGVATFARFLKISCTVCGGHIEFPTNFFGERIPCPHCQASIILQKPRNLKMSCPACEGHVAFPDYALGQKIPCPHCKMEIILKEPA
jgi:hypothetical protein